MPNVDRGGGRQSKGHDKRIARSINAKANPFEKPADTKPVLTKSPAAQRLPNRIMPESIIDCGANLISRQLQRDQKRMLQRAFDGGVDAILTFNTDFDRASEMSTLIKEYPGCVFGVYGLHPDNVKKSLNDKALQAKLDELRAMALVPECVGLFAGLDLSRDFASHFAQEKLLDAHLKLAADIKLPLVLTDTQASERLAEKLLAWREETLSEISAQLESGTGEVKDALERVYNPRAAILGFEGDEKALRGYLDAGAHICLSGVICDDTPAAAALRALLPLIPMDRLLVASLSPLYTPQTIPDEFVRQERNEPSNLPYVLPAIASAYNSGSGTQFTPAQIAEVLYKNTALFFGLQTVSEGAIADALLAPAVTVAAASCATSAQPATALPATLTDPETPQLLSSDVAAAEPAGLPSNPSVVEQTDEVATAATTTTSAATIQYRCRTCRTVLFEGPDVMPHDAAGVRPSARTLQKDCDGGDTEDDGSLGVSVSKWRETKGKTVDHLSDAGVCRALLVDQQPWMLRSGAVPDGTLACPQCEAKVGQFSLTGLKCSCGLLVAPGFKVLKHRVDAMGAGVDLDAIRAKGGAVVEETGRGEGDESREREGRREKERRKKGPVSKNKGNFSEFRNKGT